VTCCKNEAIIKERQAQGISLVSGSVQILVAIGIAEGDDCRHNDRLFDPFLISWFCSKLQGPLSLMAYLRSEKPIGLGYRSIFKDPQGISRLLVTCAPGCA